MTFDAIEILQENSRVDEHMPELGQWAFSNSEFLEAPVSELFTAALVALAREIDRVMWNSTQEEFHIGSNCGEQFIAPVFEMRDYCWCDGELAGHGKTCPPNFQWRDVKVNWYKHMGRGCPQTGMCRRRKLQRCWWSALRRLGNGSIMISHLTEERGDGICRRNWLGR